MCSFTLSDIVFKGLTMLLLQEEKKDAKEPVHCK